MYRIVVKNKAGDSLGEFPVFRSLKYGKRLNNYGTCSFSIPTNHPSMSDLVNLRSYEIYVYRDGTDDPLWSGEQAVRRANLSRDKNNWAEIISYDWIELLLHMYTDEERIFNGVDAGEIAWTLIDEFQAQTNGDLGFTEGVIEATTDRDRKYYNQNVGEAIINLSNVIFGFDFEITNSKAFNVYVTKGTDLSNDIRLEYGYNIATASIVEDFSNPVTRAIVLGESFDGDNLLRVERDDLTAQGNYKLREFLSNEFNVSEQGTLEDKGDSYLYKYKQPLLIIEQSLVGGGNPFITDFGLGDVITIKIVDGYYTVERTMRVYGWEVNYEENGVETLSLTLSFV